MDKSGSKRAAKTWGYDLLQIRVDQKEPPRAGGTIYILDKSGLERVTKTRGYDLLRALYGPLLSITNRIPGSWGLFLAHSYP